MDRVDAVDQHDRVAGLESHDAEEAAVVRVELDVDDAALDDEHLLQIVDPALERLVVVRRLPVARLVREQAELERRLRRREELRLLDLRVGPDDLGVLVTPSCSTTSTLIGD